MQNQGLRLHSDKYTQKSYSKYPNFPAIYLADLSKLVRTFGMCWKKNLLGHPQSVEVIIGRSSVAFFPAPKTIQKKIQVMPFHHLHNGLIYICMSYNFCSVTCTVGNVKTIVEFSAALKQGVLALCEFHYCEFITAVFQNCY